MNKYIERLEYMYTDFSRMAHFKGHVSQKFSDDLAADIAALAAAIECMESEPSQLDQAIAIVVAEQSLYTQADFSYHSLMKVIIKLKALRENNDD